MTGRESSPRGPWLIAALTGEPVSLEDARQACLPGWNLRCNRCGSHGASWTVGQRPGWGALALCPEHERELKETLRRHAAELAVLRQVNFEQLPQAEIDERGAIQDALAACPRKLRSLAMGLPDRRARHPIGTP